MPNGLLQIWPAFLRRGIQFKESLPNGTGWKTGECPSPGNRQIRSSWRWGAKPAWAVWPSFHVPYGQLVFFLFWSVRWGEQIQTQRQLYTYVLSMFKSLQAWRNISKAVYVVINTHIHTHSQFETFCLCNTGCKGDVTRELFQDILIFSFNIASILSG